VRRPPRFGISNIHRLKAMVEETPEGRTQALSHALVEQRRKRTDAFRDEYLTAAREVDGG